MNHNEQNGDRVAPSCMEAQRAWRGSTRVLSRSLLVALLAVGVGACDESADSSISLREGAKCPKVHRLLASCVNGFDPALDGPLVEGTKTWTIEDAPECSIEGIGDGDLVVIDDEGTPVAVRDVEAVDGRSLTLALTDPGELQQASHDFEADFDAFDVDFGKLGLDGGETSGSLQTYQVFDFASNGAKGGIWFYVKDWNFDPTIDRDIEFQGFSLQSLSLRLNAALSFEMGLVAAAEIDGGPDFHEFERTIATIERLPTLSLAGFLVPFVSDSRASATVVGHVDDFEGRLTAAAGMKFGGTLEIGPRLENGTWTFMSTGLKEPETVGPVVVGETNGDLRLGLRLDVHSKWLKSYGGTISITPFVEVNMETNTVEANAGILGDWEWRVGKWAGSGCIAPGGIGGCSNGPGQWSSSAAIKCTEDPDGAAGTLCDRLEKRTIELDSE